MQLTIVGFLSPDDSFDYDIYMQYTESNVSRAWWRMLMAMNNIAVNGGFCNWPLDLPHATPPPPGAERGREDGTSLLWG